MNNTLRTYVRSFSLAMVAYTIVLIISIWLITTFTEGMWRIPVILLPVIPVGYGLRSFMRLLESLDEMQQRIQLQAIAFASGVLCMLTFTYGFLERVGFPTISWLWIFPLFIMLWGIGLAFATRRYA